MERKRNPCTSAIRLISETSAPPVMKVYATAFLAQNEPLRMTGSFTKQVKTQAE